MKAYAARPIELLFLTKAFALGSETAHFLSVMATARIYFAFSACHGALGSISTGEVGDARGRGHGDGEFHTPGQRYWRGAILSPRGKNQALASCR